MYSYGVLMWEMYTAAQPFAGYTAFQLLSAVVQVGGGAGGGGRGVERGGREGGWRGRGGDYSGPIP